MIKSHIHVKYIERFKCFADGFKYSADQHWGGAYGFKCEADEFK